MAQERPYYSIILGLPDSCRRESEGYKDLKDVLNYMGVMAKRSKVPNFHIIISPTKEKPFVQYNFIGSEYYVPKNWRDCLYEDLETGHYYIVSPMDEKQARKCGLTQSWIAFQVTGLKAVFPSLWLGNTNDYSTKKKEGLQHTGSFIDLIQRVDIDTVLDTLAKNEKPIKIRKINDVLRIRHRDYTYWYNESVGSVCQFDID